MFLKVFFPFSLENESDMDAASLPLRFICRLAFKDACEGKNSVFRIRVLLSESVSDFFPESGSAKDPYPVPCEKNALKPKNK